MFSNKNEYALIEKPHKIVHQNIKEAVKCVKEGTCLSDIDYLVKLFKEAEDASLELFELLDSMVR
jgi:hypothetical protein